MCMSACLWHLAADAFLPVGDADKAAIAVHDCNTELLASFHDQLCGHLQLVGELLGLVGDRQDKGRSPKAIWK